MKSLGKKLLLVGRALGPYVAIELLMPGGSLVALALWLYRMCGARRWTSRIPPGLARPVISQPLAIPPHLLLPAPGALRQNCVLIRRLP
jgi:hypothetical protein